MNRFFIQHFLRNPKGVGALVPLSHHVADQLLKELSERADLRPWAILEVGAGTGNITKEILRLMRPQDHLDIIEIDEDCCNILNRRFGSNPQAKVHCRSIVDWTPDYKYDFIVSTLPLNSFSSSFVEEILKHYQNISTQNAICTYVEYIGLEKLNLLFSKKETRKKISFRRRLLNNFHKTHLIKKNKVLANFLPCYVYHMTLNKQLSA